MAEGSAANRRRQKALLRMTSWPLPSRSSLATKSRPLAGSMPTVAKKFAVTFTPRASYGCLLTANSGTPILISGQLFETVGSFPQIKIIRSRDSTVVIHRTLFFDGNQAIQPR